MSDGEKHDDGFANPTLPLPPSGDFDFDANVKDGKANSMHHNNELYQRIASTPGPWDNHLAIAELWCVLLGQDCEDHH